MAERTRNIGADERMIASAFLEYMSTDSDKETPAQVEGTCYLLSEHRAMGFCLTTCIAIA